MKAILILFISIMFCLQGVALHTQKKLSITAYDLINPLSSERADKLPRSLKSFELKNFSVKKNKMSFYFKKVFIHVEYLGQRNRVLLLNGRPFTAKELSSEKAIKQAIIAKFGLTQKRRVSSLLELFFSTANAQASAISPTPTGFSAGQNDAPPGQNDAPTTVFQGQETQTYDFGVNYKDIFSLFVKDSVLGSTTMGKNLQAAYALLAPEGQQAMFKFVSNFLLGILSIADPAAVAAGATGMDIFNLGTSPSSIRAPYQTDL